MPSVVTSFATLSHCCARLPAAARMLCAQNWWKPFRELLGASSPLAALPVPLFFNFQIPRLDARLSWPFDSGRLTREGWGSEPCVERIDLPWKFPRFPVLCHHYSTPESLKVC